MLAKCSCLLPTQVGASDPPPPRPGRQPGKPDPGPQPTALPEAGGRPRERGPVTSADRPASSPAPGPRHPRGARGPPGGSRARGMGTQDVVGPGGRSRLRAWGAAGLRAAMAKGQRRVAGSGQGATHGPGPSRGRVTHLSGPLLPTAAEGSATEAVARPRLLLLPAPRPAPPAGPPGLPLVRLGHSQVRGRNLSVPYPRCPAALLPWRPRRQPPPRPSRPGFGASPEASRLAPSLPRKVCRTREPPVNQDERVVEAAISKPVPLL